MLFWTRMCAPTKSQQTFPGINWVWESRLSQDASDAPHNALVSDKIFRWEKGGDWTEWNHFQRPDGHVLFSNCGSLSAIFGNSCCFWALVCLPSSDVYKHVYTYFATKFYVVYPSFFQSLIFSRLLWSRGTNEDFLFYWTSKGVIFKPRLARKRALVWVALLSSSLSSSWTRDHPPRRGGSPYLTPEIRKARLRRW